VDTFKRGQTRNQKRECLLIIEYLSVVCQTTDTLIHLEDQSINQSINHWFIKTDAKK